MKVKGKHAARSKKPLIWVACVVAILAIAVTAAYLFTRSGTVENTFDVAEVDCAVEEVFDSDTGVKSSIQVENTGNIDEYLRLKLISYWVDAEGHIVGKPSVMPTVDYDTEKWIKGSHDTYYCKAAVAPEENTPELLKTAVTLGTATFSNATVYQVLEVIPEAVQAAPAAAAGDLWGVTVTDDVITAVL